MIFKLQIQLQLLSYSAHASLPSLVLGLLNDTAASFIFRNRSTSHMGDIRVVLTKSLNGNTAD